MKTVKPITFDEVHNSLKEEMPDDVICAINYLIKQNYSPIKKESSFRVEDVAKECDITILKEILITKITDVWYDDIDELYNKAGWNIELYVPGRKDYSHSTLTFSKK